MMAKKKNKNTISPNKLIRIAENGIPAVRLSKSEKEYLCDYGLSEIFEADVLNKKIIPNLDKKSVAEIMQRFFPECEDDKRKLVNNISLNFKEKALEVIQKSSGWISPSPAFAYRGPTKKSISFTKKIGKNYIHIEIIRRTKRLADINVKITKSPLTNPVAFELELFRNKRYQETKNTETGDIVSIERIELGIYTIRLSDSKGEYTSMLLGIE